MRVETQNRDSSVVAVVGRRNNLAESVRPSTGGDGDCDGRLLLVDLVPGDVRWLWSAVAGVVAGVPPSVSRRPGK